ncbi:MAG TPA: bis(5'-nucleosyl)-tetraphosphatase (symmetrical) YqeK [Dehalococcoidia bacterium]|nr:bis(5'-nucleosyl)-tetraphosphatase (symmetrical) YqeK [Dehalococcoidia bacterium]
MAFRPPEELLPLLEALPRGLYSHVARVVAEVDRLRAGHQDYDRFVLAAWGHDVARAMDDAELLAKAEEYAIEVLTEELEAPILLHGAVGAEMLKRDLGWDDEDILNGVRYHTTGRPEMSEFEALIMIADKIEPAKIRDEQMRRVRALAGDDIWAALREFYSWRTNDDRRRGRPSHPRALAATDWLESGHRWRAH